MPELGVALPPNAVGRDFRYGVYAGRTDSGTGLEINLNGYAGISGVPCFILGNVFAVSGAQSPEHLAGAIERAAAEYAKREAAE